MTLKQRIIAYLQQEPKARERRFKDRALVNLLIIRYPELEKIKKETLIEMVKDYNSMDRLWRMALDEHPELRGSDYSDGKILAQEKQISLGYESGYNENIKKLKLI